MSGRKLLSAIRDDIADMRNDISALRQELRGVLVPDVGAAIAQQASQNTSSLEIPPAVAERFSKQAGLGHPEFSNTGEIPLQDGADALLRLFRRVGLASGSPYTSTTYRYNLEHPRVQAC